MPTTQPLLILCAPATMTAIVPGSLVRHCTFCDLRVWLSPSTRAWQQRSLLTPVELCCPGCLASRIREVEGFCVPHEQREEILRHFGFDAVAEFEHMLGLQVTQI